MLEIEMVRGEAGRTCQTKAMQLTKHHGLGNDFLIALADAIPDGAPAMAQAVCRRTRGVGADGLIFGLPGDPEAATDITMVLFNADGSRAEMSGNGIRCLAQAVARRDGCGQGGDLLIGTDGGIRQVVLEPTDEPDVVEVWVGMGPITPGPELASIAYPEALRFMTSYVGNPHLVIHVVDAQAVDVAADGAELSRLAGGINVEFISPRSDGYGIDMGVWERGVGVTEACGTGACAAAHAAHHWGLAGPQVPVFMPGGNVEVLLDETAMLIGPAEYIAAVDYG